MRKTPPKNRSFRPDRPQADRQHAARFPRPAHDPAPRDRAGQPNPAHPAPSVARTALLYGVHPVTAAWLNPERQCRHLYATDGTTAELAGMLADAKSAGLRRPEAIRIDRDTLDRMLPAGAVHQGVALDAEPLPEVSLEDVLIAAGDAPACLLLLDQVTDPHNVGAILRSAAAFGAKGMIVQRRHAPEITGVLAKAASGAVEVVPILRETNLSRAIEAVRDAGFFVIGLDEAAAFRIADANIPARTVLALGAEGTGLRRLVAEGCNMLARLPTVPPIRSLNVSNAAAVGLYEIARRNVGS